MANQYIDASYVDAYLGSNVRAALFTDRSGIYSESNFNILATSATAVIETALRNSGYTIPVGTVDDITTVPEYVKMATMGVFIPMAYKRPEHRLQLPEDWDNDPCQLAYEAILTGAANLETEMVLSDNGAVGGAVFSEQSTSISSSDGSRPAIFTRKGMVGY